MGVAVKETMVPLHIVVADAVIPTEGNTVAVTVMVIMFEVAVVGKAQFALDVIITFTISPFANAAEV